MKKILFLFLLLTIKNVYSQILKGIITYSDMPVKNAVIIINHGEKKYFSDSSGTFEIPIYKARLKIQVRYPGCTPYSHQLYLNPKDTIIHIHLQSDTSYLQEIIIESTRPLLNKKPDAFNTEIYDACVLMASSATNLFEGTQNINGLRPQLNCNVCNTGDIHINGMEGAYTNILIDGMPVIGGIASIYGLSGISADIIEKIEITRYPGSVLYGVDNIGGTINIITKKPLSEKNKISAEIYSSNYFDNNIDISVMKKLKKYSYVNSLNIVYFDKIFDENKEGFTDVTLQKRVSAFHKSVFSIQDSSEIQLILRTLLEDRWGGQTNWNKNFRGTDSIYGESILTDRYESIIKIPLLIKKIKIETDVSYNYHHQNSYYGTLFFEAAQHNLYHQSYTTIHSKQSNYLFGISFRYLKYTDNTSVFQNSSSYNKWIVPSMYTENTFYLHKNIQSVISARYDYHNIHKHIFTPRIAILYRTYSNKLNMRSGITTGFRPVQLFTEDHAALTGARKIEIQEKLLPEKSYVAYYNAQLNLIERYNLQLSTDFNTWFIYFTNRIIPDYSHPDKIIYYNLNQGDFSVNKGYSVQTQITYKNTLQSVFAYSLFDNYMINNQQKKRLMLSEPWSANWIVRIFVHPFKLEYTGNIYGNMLLPKAGTLDPRPDKSPVYSIQNIQINYSLKNISITAGIKNILNFTPDKNIPFLIARAHDPFDKKVVFDNEGNPIPTTENPYALTFDPSYAYASMQKRRVFFNLSFHF